MTWKKETAIKRSKEKSQGDNSIVGLESTQSTEWHRKMKESSHKCYKEKDLIGPTGLRA